MRLITQTYHFAVHGTATVAANLRRARDPEVSLCGCGGGGDVKDLMARQMAERGACLRGA